MKTFSMKPASGERTVSTSCIVCGSDAFRPFWQCDGFGFVRCRDCGHLYQNPQPLFDDLVNRYQDEYFEYELENDAQFLDLMLKGLEDIDFSSIERSLPGSRRFLDVGCATGMLLQHLKGRGWDVEGVEVCVPAAAFGREKRGVSIRVGTLDSVHLEAESFDVVHFSHVIEHVSDPRAFLEEVRRILKPSGYVVIVTPNTAGFQARLFGARWRSAIADHLNLFSKSNLARLMRETGFKIEQTRTWGGIASGMAPAFVKKPLDRLAKPLGFGDVVLQLGRRR